MDAFDNLDTLLGGSNIPDEAVSVSNDGLKFTYSLGDHAVEISSSASDIAESLKDYVDNDDSVDLSEIVDFIDSFVIAALGEDVDLSALDVSASYAFDGSTVLSMTIDDLQAHDNHEFIETNDGDVFLIDLSEDGTTANAYTPDDAGSVTFNGIDSLVAQVKADDNSLTDAEAFDIAISDALYELANEDQTDPFFV